MGWKIRNRGENLYHHIYAWGNDRHPVFKEEKHYKKYLTLLKLRAAFHTIDVIAYALMKWHVHLFIYDRRNTLADFMMGLHRDYAQYYNRDCQKTGHVFGERYNNKIVLNNIYGMWLSRYIHRQALTAGLVNDPANYQWTSYNTYVGCKNQKFIQCNIILDLFGDESNQVERYAEFVMGEDDGPVDWSHRILKINQGNHLINIMARELGVAPSTLTSPEGQKEKALRRNAILSLKKRLGFSNHQLAKLFKIAPCTIAKFTKTDLL